MRLAVIQHAPAPYRIELFNRLSEVEGWDVRVLYLFPTFGRQQWEMKEAVSDARFHYTVINPKAIGVRGKRYHLGMELYRYLGSYRPDVIIAGELGVNTIVSLLYARLHRIPMIVWWAGTAQTEREISRFKKLIRSVLVKQIDCFIAYSQAAKDYLLGLEIQDSHIVVAGNVTFDAHNYKACVDQKRQEAESWKQATGIDVDDIILLSVGALSAGKNHELLLDIMAGMPSLLKESLWLFIIGDGPLREHLEHKARLAGIKAHFLGHIKPTDLYLYYALANIFVHLTLRDRWSQVVSEAMASGLPAIVSKYDHAVELVENSREGFVVDPGQPQQIQELLEDLARHPETWRAIGEAAHEKIVQFDISFSFGVFRDTIMSVYSTKGS